MYEEILNALKTKFAGVPSEVLEKRARKLSETVTEAEGVQTAVDGVNLGDLFKAYGDSRATQASETAKEKALREFREKHNLDENGKPKRSGSEAGDEGGTQGGDNPPGWFKSHLTKLEELQTELLGFKAEKQKQERASAITGKLKGAGIPEKLHKRFSVAEDADDEALEAAITEFKQELNDLGISGLKEPGAGGDAKLSEKDYEKIMNGEGGSDEAGTVKLDV